MLMTKHLLFVGFSLQDPNFSEVTSAVRSVLRSPPPPAAASPPPSPDGAARGDGRGDEPAGTDRYAGTDRFGTVLQLHKRAFLDELWPDVNCVPMDEIDAADPRCMPESR